MNASGVSGERRSSEFLSRCRRLPQIRICPYRLRRSHQTDGSSSPQRCKNTPVSSGAGRGSQTRSARCFAEIAEGIAGCPGSHYTYLGDRATATKASARFCQHFAGPMDPDAAARRWPVGKPPTPTSCFVRLLFLFLTTMEFRSVRQKAVHHHACLESLRIKTTRARPSILT
jgi:hypothetical protein